MGNLQSLIPKEQPLGSKSTVLLATAGVVLASYWYYKRKYSYFKNRGIPGPTPLPLFGTALGMLSKGVGLHDEEVRQKYGKVAGLYESKNVLLVSDEEMLRDIFVKDFDSFANRREGSPIPDKIIMSMITALKDDEWKRVRSLLTPTFSTGKLKLMTKGVNECGALFVENLRQLADQGQEFEMKEMCGAFTMDLTARTAFGIQIDSQKDKDNEFVKYAKKLSSRKLTDPRIIIAIFFPSLIPILMKMGMPVFDTSVLKFFTNIVEQTLESREKGDRTRQDFIQLMANAHDDEYDAEEVAQEVSEDGITFEKDKSKKGLSKYEILAQGFLFFFAGYENMANSLALLFYSLACSPECQAKAHEEVDRVMGDKEEISYADVQSLTYIDQCLQESLRLYPLAARTERQAGRDTVVKGIPIAKGTVVAIPIQTIHMDPEIWPEPLKFDPDRFSPEERARHSPFDHLPFGYGPRNCIAMRLALWEAKMAAALVLKNFTICTCEKTQIPLKFEARGVSAPEKGIWLKLQQR